MALEQFFEKHTEAVVVIGLAAVGTVWKVISMAFRLHNRVESAHKRLDRVEQQAKEDHNELRQDIKDLTDKVDESYNRILDKIDESRREATGSNNEG